MKFMTDEEVREQGKILGKAIAFGMWEALKSIQEETNNDKMQEVLRKATPFF